MLRVSSLKKMWAGFANRRTRRSRSAVGSAIPQLRRYSPVRLELQLLEDRTVPASIIVSSTADLLYQAKTAMFTTVKGTTISLRDAINIANNTPGPDTIVLTAFQTYKLNKIDNYWYGPNGMPAISSEVTIQGNGAQIMRVGGPNFRIFYVSNVQYGGLATGSLTLQGLTLQGGVAEGGDSYRGGGGLGAGGAIFNQGNLVLDSVLLTNNSAQGGTSSGSINLFAGGGIGQDAPDHNNSNAGGGFGGPLPGSVNFATGGPTREGQGGKLDGLPSPWASAGFGGGGMNGVSGAQQKAGGFGGGGGGDLFGNPGPGGFGGGVGASYGPYWYPSRVRGGGGAGLGGALFNRGGNVAIINSTITNNTALGGDGARYLAGYRAPSGAGSGFGGGIFNLNGTVQLTNSTIASNNVAPGSPGYYRGGGGFDGRADGPQVYNLADSLNGATATATLTLANTILAGASSGEHDLVNQTFANAQGNVAKVSNVPDDNAANNIITTDIPNYDGNFASGGNGVVIVGFTTADPQLRGLSNNGGWTLTMATGTSSPARNAGLSSVAVNASGTPLTFDGRGAPYQRIFGTTVDIGAFQAQQYQQYPEIARLAYYDSASKLFLPFQVEHSITNNTTTGTNVYVISHGWMSGYDVWVNQATSQGDLPLSWQTWQGGVGKAPYYGPSTPWLYQGSNADTYKHTFQLNANGLAQSILKADPNAKVLAFSWIDESATSVDGVGIPEQGWQSEGYTTMAGMQMAEGLMEALAPNYHDGLGKVHLIGHSHGARVVTVAALALQKAAVVNSQFDVVGQLTLLDSPEDNSVSYPDSSRNSVYYQDTANYDWFNLAQLNIAQPGANVNTQNTASPIFVDSYISYFGSLFGNIKVNAPGFGINAKSLDNVVDVKLDPYPIFENHYTDIGLKHEYPANWYAGSVVTKGKTYQTGLFWSPLIKGSKAPTARQFSQLWTPVSSARQFVLTKQQRSQPVEPVFSQSVVTYQGSTGDVLPEGQWTGVILNDDLGTATFNGTFNKPDSVVGFAFTYNFAGECVDGAQLQILLNGNLYMAIDASVAVGLPGTSQFSTTFGLGTESTGTQSITIKLVKPQGNQAASTTVTVDNFHVFTL